MITWELLKGRFDVEANERVVKDKVQAAAADFASLTVFLARYVSWNSAFGSSVASLSGKVGLARDAFFDPDEPLRAVADRSVFVASFFFDAARDEFDDRDTKTRDTHRCLAQALLRGIVAYAREHDDPGCARLRDPVEADRLLADLPWVKALRADVVTGYAGGGDDRAALCRNMGFHVGSEILAHEEFSLLDAELRRRYPGLVDFLKRTDFTIAGAPFNAYAWLRIHSGHGGAVEMDHFCDALRGVEHALSFSPADERAALRDEVLKGFDLFVANHQRFFGAV